MESAVALTASTGEMNCDDNSTVALTSKVLNSWVTLAIPGSWLGSASQGGAAPAASSSQVSPASLQAPATEFRQLLAIWDQVRIELEKKHPDIAPYVGELAPMPVSGAPDSFSLEFGDTFCFRRMKSPEKQASFLGLVREVTGAPWNARLIHEGQELLVRTVPPPDPARDSAETAADSGRASPDSARGADDSGRAPHDSSDSAEAATGPSSSEGNAGTTAQAGGISKDPVVTKSVELFSGRLI